MTDRSAHQPSSARRIVRVTLQIIGFAIGLALLWWSVSLALSEENREQIEKLGSASWRQVALLMSLTVVMVIVNGLIWHETIRPVRKVPMSDCQAANALATFLAYLPFKLSVISRWIIHTKRNNMPFLLVGGWIGAVAATGAISMLPPVAPTLVIGQINALWVVSSLLLVGVCCAITVTLSRWLGGERGLTRIRRFAAVVRLRLLNRFLHSEIFEEGHRAMDLLASWRTVLIVCALRMIDLAVQSARIALAASMIGVEIPLDQAVLLALVYFLIGVLTPVGMLGTREGGTMGAVAAMLGMSLEEVSPFAGVLLLVTGSESIVLVAMAGLSIIWLRPDRLIRRSPEQSADLGAIADADAPEYDAPHEDRARADQPDDR